MILIRKSILDDFTRKHPDSIDWIGNWVFDVEGSEWETPKDIKVKYPSASILFGNIVVFNVKGNHYRLEVKVAYKTATIIAVWAGTHAEYDKRNKKK